MKSLFVSFIIPTFKQGDALLEDIVKLKDSLESIGKEWEIIVVADGFLADVKDRMANIKDKRIKLIGYEKNQGKGNAVKYGVLRAKGDIIGFIDAGMDLDSAEIPIMLNIMDWNEADIVIGSKLHPDSKVRYPFVRRLMSWGYRTLTLILFGFMVRDTQVGLKIFKREVAREIFKRILVKKFAFDVETLAIASSLGYNRIYEAPIKLNFRRNTINSLNFWRTILRMLWDTAAVFYRLRILHYYDKPH